MSKGKAEQTTHKLLEHCYKQKGSEETAEKTKTVTKGQENEIVTKAWRQILLFSLAVFSIK